MANGILRNIYHHNIIQYLLDRLGLDFLIRSKYSRFQELKQGETTLSVEGSEVTLSNTAIPSEEYLDPEIEVLEDIINNLEEGDVFFDIGADKGLFTCPVATTAGVQVVAFEPHPVRRAELERNLGRNNLSVDVCTDALSNTTGRAEFSYRIKPDSDGTESTGFVVDLSRGDGLVPDAYPTPTVLKIDVEGAELDVLRGFSETIHAEECRLIYIELHGRISDFGGSWEELKAYLRDAGFTLETITERHGDGFTQPFLKGEKRT